MPDSALMLRGLIAAVEDVLGTDIGYASDQEAIVATLRMLEAREVHGARHLEAALARLRVQLRDVAKDIQKDAPDLAEELGRLAAQTDMPAPGNARERDAAERRIFGTWAELAGRIAADARLARAWRRDLVASTVIAERERALERMGGRLAPRPEENNTITPERLRDYLRARFADPGIEVTACKALPGGYGKETTLFEVSGSALSGAFVMRRDRLIPTMDNDCHRIEHEFPVIRAAHERGFPAPEALWLDTEHELLPGGNFIVMRRAPGTAGGNVFGAAGVVSKEMTELLATSMARLHSLPPLTELGKLTDGIAPELWELSPKEATKRYIASIRDMYVAEMVMPSPAALAIYGWLLDNVPDSPGRAVLLHGDIGFHNFIVDEGRLTAVVDWEFAHVGDPAEDVGYVRNTSGSSLDWPTFIAAYRAAGGPEIDEQRLRYFQLWGQLRNMTASQLTSNGFDLGRYDNLKLAHVGHSMMPDYLDAIERVLVAERAG